MYACTTKSAVKKQFIGLSIHPRKTRINLNQVNVHFCSRDFFVMKKIRRQIKREIALEVKSGPPASIQEWEVCNESFRFLIVNYCCKALYLSRHLHVYMFFIVNFEHISHLVLVFLLLTLRMPAGILYFCGEPAYTSELCQACRCMCKSLANVSVEHFLAAVQSTNICGKKYLF